MKKTRPLYEKADNPNARLIRAVALRSSRLRPRGFPQGGSCPHLRTDEGVMFPSFVLTLRSVHLLPEEKAFQILR